MTVCVPSQQGEAGGRKIVHRVGGIPVSTEGSDAIRGESFFVSSLLKAEKGCRLPLCQ